MSHNVGPNRPYLGSQGSPNRGLLSALRLIGSLVIRPSKWQAQPTPTAPKDLAQVPKLQEIPSMGPGLLERV